MNSVSDILKPKSKADIIHDLSKLTKAELGYKLLSASRNGNKDIVQCILDAGADVNAKTNGGWTALMYASQYGFMDIAKLFIGAGADVNVKGLGGWTALKMASYNGHKDIVTLLKKHVATK